MSAFRNSHKCHNAIIKHCSLQFKDFQVLWRISSVFGYFQFSAPNSTTISDFSSTLSTQWRVLQLIWLRENTGQGQLHDSRQLINFIIKSSSLQPKRVRIALHLWPFVSDIVIFVLKGTLTDNQQPKSSPSNSLVILKSERQWQTKMNRLPAQTVEVTMNKCTLTQ